MLEKGREFLVLKAQKIRSIYFFHPYFWAYFVRKKTLNCDFIELGRAFDLIPMLRTRPKYQFSFGSVVLEDYT